MMHANLSTAITTRDGVTMSSSLNHGDARHAGPDIGTVLIEGQTNATTRTLGSVSRGPVRTLPRAQARTIRLARPANLRTSNIGPLHHSDLLRCHSTVDADITRVTHLVTDCAAPVRPERALVDQRRPALIALSHGPVPSDQRTRQRAGAASLCDCWEQRGSSSPFPR